MPASRRSAGTVDVMVRWLPRILVLVTLVGLLAMHGIDATATAAHESQVAVDAESQLSHDMSPMAGQERGVERSTTTSDPHGSLHHVAVACLFALVAVAAFGIRRLVVRATRRTMRLAQTATAAMAATFRAIWHPPQPAWVRLCVIRH
jgi:hypothetical protein